MRSTSSWPAPAPSPSRRPLGRRAADPPAPPSGAADRRQAELRLARPGAAGEPRPARAGAAAQVPPAGGPPPPPRGAASTRATPRPANGKLVVFNVPKGRSLEITDLLVENSAGNAWNLTLASSGTPVMQWAMANFRDLDYHWITPTVFGPGTQVQMIVSGCNGPCTPAIY